MAKDLCKVLVFYLQFFVEAPIELELWPPAATK